MSQSIDPQDAPLPWCCILANPLFILLVKLFELELPDPFKGIKKILEPLIVSQESIWSRSVQQFIDYLPGARISVGTCDF